MTFEKLKEIIVDKLTVDADKIQLETDLKKDLKADSLDIIEIIMAIEDEFGVEVDDDAALNFVTIADVVNYLDSMK